MGDLNQDNNSPIGPTTHGSATKGDSGDFNLSLDLEKVKIGLVDIKSQEEEFSVKLKNTNDLVMLGFAVLLIMAAAIVVAVFAIFISMVLFFGNDNKLSIEKLYEFQKLNNNGFITQQIEFNILKNCLQNGWKNSCFK